MTDDIDTLRFAVPLYTTTEAARMLDVPHSLFGRWAAPVSASGSQARALVTTVSCDAGTLTVPFVGIAEGLVVAAIHRTGVPTRRIRLMVDELKRRTATDHVLASSRLRSEGPTILSDYAQHANSATLCLTVTRDSPTGFRVCHRELFRQDRVRRQRRLRGGYQAPVV